MAKRPSLFASKPAAAEMLEVVADDPPVPAKAKQSIPPSREGKRALTVYLDPLAWKQLRQLALDADTTTQALGEEAVNLLFTKHGLNRTA